MLTLTFTAQLWKYSGKAAWYFVTLPDEDAHQIRFFKDELPHIRGMVKTQASIGKSSWSTSLLTDKASNSYLLPIKATIRTSEQLDEGDNVTVTLKPGM